MMTQLLRSRTGWSRGLTRERLMELEQRTVPGVGIGQQYRIWQVLTQKIGIPDRHHFIVNAIHDQRWLAYALEISEALARRFFPFTEGAHLSLGDGRTGDRFTIRAALHESVCEGLSCLLARFRRREEELLQNGISLKLRIVRRRADGRSSAICCATMPPSE